jgi:hypothetical protein
MLITFLGIIYINIPHLDHEACQWPIGQWFALWRDRYVHRKFGLGAKDLCHDEGLFGVSP